MECKAHARRLLALTAACVVLFLISSAVAYAQRGYLAVGGEYAFVAIPALTLITWALGGGDRHAQ